MHFDEKCIRLGLQAAYQKVNSSPQLPVLTKGSVSDNSGGIEPLCVFLLFCLGVFDESSWPAGGPELCFPKVNFQSREEPALVCVEFGASFLKPPSECGFTAEWFWPECTALTAALSSSYMQTSFIFYVIYLYFVNYIFTHNLWQLLFFWRT